jgi:hypothetical protein
MAEAAPRRLAAIIFDKGEDPDAPLRDFIAAARARGVKISGLVQERCEDDGRRLKNDDPPDLRVRDLDTGETLPIMQNLGAASEGCRVDPAAIANAARLLDNARARKPDLLIVNRFGRLESEGGGMLAEIGQAVADDEALLICVPLRYREAWNAFAEGLDEQLRPVSSDIDAWWRDFSRDA